MIVVWLATESAGQMTRLSRLALTVSFVLIMLATVYCSIFIWKDDVEILIYPLTPITKYQIWRLAFSNIIFLVGGSLYTTFIADWQEGKFMLVVCGYVMRKEVMALDSLLDVVKGNSKHEVWALTHKVTTHHKASRSSVVMAQMTAEEIAELTC
jgi:hypothetical protein